MKDKSAKTQRRILLIVCASIVLIFELTAGIFAYFDYLDIETSYSGLYTYIFDMLLIPAVIGLICGIIENFGQRLLTNKNGTRTILLALLKLLGALALHSVLCQILYETAYCIAQRNAQDSIFVFSVYESLMIFRYAIGIGLALFILTSAIALALPNKDE